MNFLAEVFSGDRQQKLFSVGRASRLPIRRSVIWSPALLVCLSKHPWARYWTPNCPWGLCHWCVNVCVWVSVEQVVTCLNVWGVNLLVSSDSVRFQFWFLWSRFDSKSFPSSKRFPVDRFLIKMIQTILIFKFRFFLNILNCKLRQCGHTKTNRRQKVKLNLRK